MIQTRARAETAPGAAQQAVLKYDFRKWTDYGAWGSWSAGSVLVTIDIPTNEYYQKDTDSSLSLSTLGISGEDKVQFEFTRAPGDASDTLSDDLLISQFQIEVK